MGRGPSPSPVTCQSSSLSQTRSLKVTLLGVLCLCWAVPVARGRAWHSAVASCSCAESDPGAWVIQAELPGLRVASALIPGTEHQIPRGLLSSEPGHRPCARAPVGRPPHGFRTSGGPKVKPDQKPGALGCSLCSVVGTGAGVPPQPCMPGVLLAPTRPCPTRLGLLSCGHCTQGRGCASSAGTGLLSGLRAPEASSAGYPFVSFVTKEEL